MKQETPWPQTQVGLVHGKTDKSRTQTSRSKDVWMNDWMNVDPAVLERNFKMNSQQRVNRWFGCISWTNSIKNAQFGSPLMGFSTTMGIIKAEFLCENARLHREEGTAISEFFSSVDVSAKRNVLIVSSREQKGTWHRKPFDTSIGWNISTRVQCMCDLDGGTGRTSAKEPPHTSWARTAFYM